MQDEKNLIERAQKRDPEAFAQIYEAYFDRIYRYVAIRVGTQTEAEDLTQQVFLNALESIPSYRWKGAPFAAWLFRIAHNQVIDHYRRFSRVQMTALEMPVATHDPDPVDMIEQEMDIERIRGAIGALTDLQQEVISLRFVGELSTAETAKIMGKNEGAVKALQHSALGALKRALSGGRDNGKEV
ncbi:MAG: sigma-70 family RNA polymerase sigma factor [Chloroflexi bacterium]|nr:sigma-70 family RNA polymerase sigma factor [Chloroflexota bacterium]